MAKVPKGLSSVPSLLSFSATSPSPFANIALAQGEIAYRQGDYAAARRYAQSAASVFSRANAEPYQMHALESLLSQIRRDRMEAVAS